MVCGGSVALEIKLSHLQLLPFSAGHRCVSHRGVYRLMQSMHMHRSGAQDQCTAFYNPIWYHRMRIKGTFEKRKITFIQLLGVLKGNLSELGLRYIPELSLQNTGVQARCHLWLKHIMLPTCVGSDGLVERCHRIKISGAQLPHVYMLSLGLFFDQKYSKKFGGHYYKRQTRVWICHNFYKQFLIGRTGAI